MVYISMYILAMAIAAIMIHQLGIVLPLSLMLSLPALYAIVFYNLININNLTTVYRRLYSAKWKSLLAMASAALMIVISFQVAIEFGPAVHVFTFMAVNSALGLMAAFLKNRQARDLIQCLTVIAILVIFYVLYGFGLHLAQLAKLIAMTLSTGSLCFVYMVSSNSLSYLGCSASEVLAMRYWVLLFVGSVMMFYQHDQHLINSTVLMQTFVLSMLFMVLPIYFLQKSIERIGAYFSAVFMGIVPFATFLLQKLTMGHAERVTGVLAFILAIVIIAPYLVINLRRLRRKKMV